MRRGQIEGAGSDGAASGLTLESLREYGGRAARFAALLDSNDIADLAVDTDDISVPQVARRVLAQVSGWPELHDVRIRSTT